MERLHCTCVRVDGTGVLLCGRPAGGKSDLALRLIDGGGVLVADDYTEVEARDGRLFGHAPETIRGLLEVRGIGVVKLDFADEAAIGLIIELVPGGENIERLPDPAARDVQGVALPLFRLSPFEASAISKVRLAVRITDGSVKCVP